MRTGSRIGDDKLYITLMCRLPSHRCGLTFAVLHHSSSTQNTLIATYKRDSRFSIHYVCYIRRTFFTLYTSMRVSFVLLRLFGTSRMKGCTRAAFNTLYASEFLHKTITTRATCNFNHATNNCNVFNAKTIQRKIYNYIYKYRIHN